MRNKFKYFIFFIILILSCSSCTFEHTHSFIDGKCECGEIKIVQYTVTFIGFNNEVLLEVEVEEGKDATFPLAPSVDGYNFIGWDQEATNVQSDLEIKAQYELIPVKTYVVRFIGFNGELLLEVEVEEGKDATFPLAPTVDGYNFIGWDQEATNVQSDLEVKAQYELIPVKTYVVKFIGFNGEILLEVEVEEGQDVKAPEAPAVEGYNFIGWDQEATNVQSDLEVKAIYQKEAPVVKTAQQWLDEVKFGINYMNGIKEDNDNNAYFNWIKEQGFNAVEIGCRFPELVESINGDLNDERVTKLKSIIDTAYRFNLYIILSLYDGYEYMWTSLNINNQASILKMLDTSYRKLMIALKGYDDRLAISFCVEPRDYTDNLVDAEDIEVLNTANAAFVKMVRSTGGNNKTRKLVITTGWSKCEGLPAQKFKMVDDEYTMVRVHLYQPSNFSGSKTSDSIWLEEEYHLVLLKYFQAIKENFIDKNIPVYIGEFGVRPKDNDQERNKWAKCYLSLANSYNVKCFIWDTENSGSGIANSYAISNKKKLVWLNPEFMNYVLYLVDGNYIPFYNTYNKTINITDEIVIPEKIVNLITNEEEAVEIKYDSNKVIVKDGKVYPKESGVIVFSYTLNDYNYYYQYEVVGTMAKADFDLKIKTDSTGKTQCIITTAGFSNTRLDYNWSTTNKHVLTVSKYSTITIVGDGECSIIAENIKTGQVGIIDIVVTNGKISSAISRKSGE